MNKVSLRLNKTLQRVKEYEQLQKDCGRLADENTLSVACADIKEAITECAGMYTLLARILNGLGTNPMGDDELAAEIRKVLKLKDGQIIDMKTGAII